jgi:hypothetical protein
MPFGEIDTIDTTDGNNDDATASTEPAATGALVSSVGVTVGPEVVAEAPVWVVELFVITDEPTTQPRKPTASTSAPVARARRSRRVQRDRVVARMVLPTPGSNGLIQRCVPIGTLSSGPLGERCG